MWGERRNKRSAFEAWALVLTAVILAMMFGRLAVDLLCSGTEVWVGVERTDSARPNAPEDGEQADSLLEGEVMNLNTASAADLERLPGVGAVRAQAVVDYRQAHGSFSSVDDLRKVDGIGPGILEQLRPYVTVG